MEGQDATAEPGESRQSPGPPSLSVEPCGGSNMHQLFGGSRRDVSPQPPPSSHLRLHPMSNDQLHHTSHSRYIRRHNVGVRAQHAPFSRPHISLSLFFSLFLVLASRTRLFGSLGRNLLIAKVQAHQQTGRETKRINLLIIPE